MSFMSPAAHLAATTALSTRPRGVYATPRADASNIAAVLAELKQTFETFKAENDTKLKAKADVVLDEKVERINSSVADLQAAVDTANLKLAALATGAGGQPQQSAEDRAYASDFAAYFKHGEKDNELKAAHRAGIRAAMSVGSTSDGGFLAPVEWDRTITGKVKQISQLRSVATVQTISTSGFRKVFTDRAVGSGWVGETAARPQTTNPQFVTLDYVPGEIYANPAATQQILDDALINLEEWLAGEVDAEFARQEGIAFISGDGVNKPKGILTYVTGAPNAAAHPWGAIPTIASGQAAKLTPDGLVSLIYDLQSDYTDGARFLMNRSTMGGVRGFKDSTGQYLWQVPLQAGQPSTLLGFPVVEAPAMPNVAASAAPVIFGNFARGYLIVDRIGVRVLRDPFTNKPYVNFYTTKRVGGGVLDPQALRVQTVATS